MDSPHKLLAERVMNRAMPLNSAHVRKYRRTDGHSEMTLPTLLIPRMPPVKLAFVHDFKDIRLKCDLKLFAYFFNYSHFFAPYLFKFRGETVNSSVRVGKASNS